MSSSAASASATPVNVRKDILDAFWKLSDSKDGARLDAAAKIIESCKEPSDDEYVLSRLVRGLASDRISARKGFYVALVEYLRRRNDSKLVPRVRELISKHLTPHGGSKGEEGEYLCGQLFCLGALLRSGLLQGEEVGEIVRDIVALTKRRSYLLLSGYKFLVDLILRMASDEEFTQTVWPALQDTHEFKTEEALTLETIWLLLIIQQKFPGIVNQKFCQKNFGRSQLVDESLCQAIARCKDNVTTPVTIIKQHPVFPVAIDSLRKAGLSDYFWQKHLCPTISAGRPSYQTMLTLSILEMLLDSSEDKVAAVDTFLTPNLVEFCRLQVSKVESTQELDAKIFGLLSKLTGFIEDNAEGQKTLLKALLCYPGNIAFDKVTGGNIVTQLQNSCGAEAIKFAGELYRQAALGHQPCKDNTASSPPPTTNERIFAAHQLAKLTGHTCMAKDIKWQADNMSFLLTLTQFNTKGEKVSPMMLSPKPFSNRESRLNLANTFYKALDYKVRNIEDHCQVLMMVTNHADQLLDRFSPLNEDFKLEAWKKMIKEVKAIDKGSDSATAKEEKIFQFMFLHMGLQLFSEPTMACDMLDELKVCHDKAKSKKEKQQRRNKLNDPNGTEPQWVEVVVDILLFLLSREKHIYRQLANSVFAVLCPHMTDQALIAIMDVVNPPKDDLEAEDGESDDNDASWEDIESDDDSKMSVDGENGNTSDSEEEPEDEEEDDENVADIKSKVKFALGEHAAEASDQESIDMDDIDEEDMKKMDQALANVFRQLSNKKSGEQQRREKKVALAAVHFKLRALDLIEVYLKHSPLVSHAVMVLERLLAALDNAIKLKEGKELEQRLVSALKKLAAPGKKSPHFRADPEITKDKDSLFTELLASMVELANKSSPVVGLLEKPIPLFSQCCLMLLKLCQQSGEEELLNKVNNIYLKALDDFFMKNHCLLPMTFFLLPIKSNWSGSWEAADKIVAKAFDAKTRMFRRTQALSLLKALFTNPNLQQEQLISNDRRRQLAQTLLDFITAELNIYTLDRSKPRYLSDLLELSHSVFTCSIDGVEWQNFKQALEKVRKEVPGNKNFCMVKKSFNKVAAPLKADVIVASDKKRQKIPKPSGKPEEETMTNDSNVQEGPKDDCAVQAKTKKKKRSKDGLKEKKQNKEQTLMGQFEGLEMPSFAGLNLKDSFQAASVQNHDEMSEDEEAPRKKNAKRTKKVKKNNLLSKEQTST